MTRKTTRPERGSNTIARRRFLAILGGGTAGVALAPVRAVAGDRGRSHRGRTKVAYRLSTHGLRVCHACKAHAANRFYRTPKAADRDRAHRGCNCAIVPHPLQIGTYNRYFANRNDVWDIRWNRRRISKGGR